jgi:DNA-binding response OmpR family regulator
MSKAVYILEDEFGLRSTLYDFLKQKGYEVSAYSDPSFCPLSEIASRKCNCQDPCTDFIITDINMPGMTGIKFIEFLKGKSCKVPHVAIMSASWTESEYQQAKDLGCKILEKPFNFSDLIQWMKHCEENTFYVANELNSCNH